MSVPIQFKQVATATSTTAPGSKEAPKWRSAHAWKWLFAVAPNPMTWSRADKGWAVKRARPSKKVWRSGLGLCLEMWLVFDFGQGLQCGLSIRHCRCHWIMAAWFVFLHFFLVPLCWYAATFCGRFNWSRQTSLSKGSSYYLHDSTTELYFRSTTRQCRCYSETKQLSTV